MARIRALQAAALVALLSGAPRIASACSVCSSGRDDETRAAFIWTTVLLSVLPLGMVGGMVVWLRRRTRALERERHGAVQGGRPAPALSRASSTP